MTNIPMTIQRYFVMCCIGFAMSFTLHSFVGWWVSIIVVLVILVPMNIWYEIDMAKFLKKLERQGE